MKSYLLGKNYEENKWWSKLYKIKKTTDNFLGWICDYKVFCGTWQILGGESTKL